MDDTELIGQIDKLVAEEHDLEHRHIGEGLKDSEKKRLDQLQVQLDRCWDLLRQRRARRAAGQDPDRANPRPESVVESYEQ